MSKKIRLKIHERILRNNQGKLKCCYLTSLAPAQKITVDESCTKIAERTKMSEPKVHWVLNEVMDYALRQLMQGYIVELPELGTLRLAIKSKAKARHCDAGEKAIESISLNYLPTVKAKKMLELTNLQFKIEE